MPVQTKQHDRSKHDHQRPPDTSTRRQSTNTSMKSRTGRKASQASVKSVDTKSESKTCDSKHRHDTHADHHAMREKVREEVVIVSDVQSNGTDHKAEADTEPEPEVQQPEVKQDERPTSPVEQNELTHPQRTTQSSSNEFDIKMFNESMHDFAEIFSSDKYQNVDEDYPVEELVSIVSAVSDTIQEFKKQTAASQKQLEELREKMKNVKENIQTNIQKKRFQIRIDDDSQSVEERELNKKLARLNAQVAQAHADLADALKLSAETESTAVEAQLSAEKAKEEASRIEEEVILRKQLEERRRREEEQRMEEAKRLKEEEQRREEDARRQNEAEWRRKEALGENKPAVWEKWPVYEFKAKNQDKDELTCIIRAHPTRFNENQVTCEIIDQLNCPMTFGAHEELVSHIIQLPAHTDDFQLQDPIFVSIPYVTSRLAGLSREPVVKAEMNGHWVELETKEETGDHLKEHKFAQAELKFLTKLAVVTRLKRDYVTLSKRGGKVTSSYDQRVTITVPKDAIPGKDHMLMEVQPVDSASVNDLRTRSPKCKGLLTSSHIVKTAWESSDFNKPLTVTVPCPPNPAKAKKIAAMRKAKEEKMKNPRGTIQTIEEIEKEKEKKKLQTQQELDLEEKKLTKWYMGEYANSDDDENDHLYLVSGHSSGRWTLVPDVRILQVKLDLLQFDLEEPLERFVVLRTRTNINEETVAPMAKEVCDFLSQKFAQVILKQSSDDPFDTTLAVVPVSKTEKTLKRLAEDGYDDGPDPSPVVSINEGDVIEVSFRGNVKNTKGSDNINFVYNSNLDSEADFYASEVDRYLQRNLPLYRGVVQVHKRYQVKQNKRLQRKDSRDDMHPTEPEVKRDLLCELAINIPKYHVAPSSTPMKAPVTIVNNQDAVNDSMMRHIAEELGDEWRILANNLNLSKARIQAILRNMQYCDHERTEEEVKFEMLMTWLKKMPKAVDKVNLLSMALLKSGRGDLAEDIKVRDQEFRESHRGLSVA